VVHCQPAGHYLSALKYLAPNTYRVAIRKSRIVKMTNERVIFRCMATNTGKPKTCTLSVEEFIRRFLQHVPLTGYVKVRYYSFFSPSHRAWLACLREQLGRS
jgi:hypothetical protein